MRILFAAYALLVIIVLSPILLHGVAKTIELVSRNDNQPVIVRTTTFLEVAGKRVAFRIPLFASIIALIAAIALIAIVVSVPFFVSEMKA